MKQLILIIVLSLCIQNSTLFATEIQHFVMDTIDPAPVFPYGGVYFRKSNPPEDDWERDYKTAAELGVNIMRHWFMWAVVEVAPGEYDGEWGDDSLCL